MTTEASDGTARPPALRPWHAPKLTNLGELDSHTGAQTQLTDDASGSGTLGGDSDTTS